MPSDLNCKVWMFWRILNEWYILDRIISANCSIPFIHVPIGYSHSSFCYWSFVCGGVFRDHWVQVLWWGWAEDGGCIWCLWGAWKRKRGEITTKKDKKSCKIITLKNHIEWSYNLHRRGGCSRFFLKWSIFHFNSNNFLVFQPPREMTQEFMKQQDEFSLSFYRK